MWTMPETLYRIRVNGVTWRTTDTTEAQRLSNDGARVSAVVTNE